MTQNFYTYLSPQKLLENIREMGLVGAGGAGFPTHIKLRGQAEIIIGNGAECEPLLHKDKELMSAEPDVIVDGLRMAMAITGAHHAIIGVKDKAKSAIQALSPLMDSSIRLKILRDIYPAGDELILLHETTGRIPYPGDLPIHVGAVVMNVETLYWLGSKQPVTHKWVTVAGDVPNPATFLVPLGIPIRMILESSGCRCSETGGILMGGAMMGQLSTSLESPVTKTLGGLIVLPVNHPLLRRYQRPDTSRNRIGKSVCDQCSFCTQLCPRYLIGHPVKPHLAMRHLMMAPGEIPPPPESRFCCGCNLCSFWSCPEDLDPGIITMGYRRRLLASGAVTPLYDPPQPNPLYDYRKPTLTALKRRLGLDRFIDAAPIRQFPISPTVVSIPLKQHVGVPAIPVVRPGDAVQAGQLIGRIPDGELGAAVHASITGFVTNVTDTITIQVVNPGGSQGR